MLQKGGNFLLETIAPADVFTPEDLSEEHKMIANTCADFAQKEIVPLMDEIDTMKEGLLRSLLEKAGELGLLSADISEEYDGSDLGKLASLIITENLAVGGGSFAVGHGAHTGIGSLPIVLFGNEEQKKRYLPGLASGSLIAAYALTEPGAGSDALGARTKAVLSEDGKYYILNGEKMFISNTGFADVFITYAKIDGEKFTAFIVDKNTPGFSFGAEEKKMGLKGSSTRSLIFEDAKVPVENLLGEIGRGHVIAFNILNIGRLKLGAGCIGASRAVIGHATKYALERVQFKQPIANFGMIRHKLAQMNIKTFAAESVNYRLGGMIEESMEDKNTGSEIAAAIEEYALECSISKVLGSEVLSYVTDEGVQIFGGYGYISEYPAERAYRDARINRIFEGTNEINRLLIPGTLMRRAMKGQLNLMGAIQELKDNIAPASVPNDGKPLAAERAMVESTKRLFLLLCDWAVQKYMTKLAEEQEILAIMADMVINIYASESSILRALKTWEKNPGEAATQIIMAQAYCHDVFPLFEKWAIEVIMYLFEDHELKDKMDIMKKMTSYEPVNLIALRRHVAERVIDGVKYVAK